MGLFSPKERALKKLRQVADLDHLPPFPASVTRILDKLRDPKASMGEVAEAVSWDPGLVVRLLKIVNSAAYGLRRTIDNARQAVVFLGRSNLESLVLGLAVENALPHESAHGFEPKRYWRAAARRAALARNVAEKLDPATQTECFTVGLLQDLAVPILAHAKPDLYGPILDQWHGSQDENLDALERSALGWSHADVGGTVCEAWDLPESLVRGVRGHHAEESSSNPPGVQLVSLMHETQDEICIETLVETARSNFGLDPDWTREAVDRAEEQASGLARLMG